MEVELERSDNPEVATAASKPPEEFLVLLRAGGQELAVRRDEFDGDEIVARQAVLTAEVANTAAESESRDARIRDDAPGGRETERLCLVIQIRPRRTRLNPRGLRVRVDSHTRHRREIDDDSSSQTALPATL